MSSCPNVLVTGGAGYVGSHTCKALAQAGYCPVTLDNLSRGHSSAVKWGPLVKGDVGDRSLLDLTFAEYRPIAVLHFAAYAYVGESVSQPALYYRNNSFNSLTLLEAMRDHGVAAVVFSSTCATYGRPERLPVREDDLQRPVNPYGESKLMVERMLRDFDIAHGSRFVTLRYFNAAGSDPDGEIGWSHEPETRLIPRALMAARGDIPVLDVFGDDFATHDGTCIRDYVHVSDLASAHVLALRYLIKGGRSVALNVGTGNGYSIRAVVRAVETVTRRAVSLQIAPRRAGDPAALIADPAMANAVLGLSRYHSLDHIVRTAWRWIERRSIGHQAACCHRSKMSAKDPGSC